MSSLLVQAAAKAFYWLCYVSAVLSFYVKRAFALVAPNYSPVRGGDQTVSLRWLQDVVAGRFGPDTPAPLSATINRKEIRAGLTGDMFKIAIEWPDSAAKMNLPKSLVVKAVMPSTNSYLSSILLGSAREALFYEKQASGADVEKFDFVPQSLDARASWTTGDYAVTMEDLSADTVHCGALLGNQCWGPAQIPEGVETDPRVILGTIFNSVASLHAAYWRDGSLLKLPWLKACDWLQGRGRMRWELAQSSFKSKWARVRPPKGSSDGKSVHNVIWSAKVVSLVDQFWKATSWESYRESFQLNDPKTPWTLVHGDFHAANVLWCRNPGKTKFYLVDYPEIGLGDPFTELAQFMISNATIPVRRQLERQLFEDYWNVLIKKGVSAKDFPLEDCWERYKIGGIERWLQMLILLANIGATSPKSFPPVFVQWFHDQVAAFVEDHFASSKLPPIFRSVYCLA